MSSPKRYFTRRLASSTWKRSGGPRRSIRSNRRKKNFLITSAIIGESRRRKLDLATLTKPKKRCNGRSKTPTSSHPRETRSFSFSLTFAFDAHREAGVWRGVSTEGSLARRGGLRDVWESQRDSVIQPSYEERATLGHRSTNHRQPQRGCAHSVSARHERRWTQPRWGCDFSPDDSPG